MHELDKALQHSGIRGMKWGIRRDRNRPGGADGKDTSKSKVESVVAKYGKAAVAQAIRTALFVPKDSSRKLTKKEEQIVKAVQVATLSRNSSKNNAANKTLGTTNTILSLITQSDSLEDNLQHTGIRGMKWGIRRDRNRPGGADGKEESAKVVDKRSVIGKKLDSMKRERQWKQILKDFDKLNTTDVRVVTKRIERENSLKTLSREVGNKKDKADYLRREHMSDAELTRKVNRLQAKKSLHKAVGDASKEQREFGEKVVNIAKGVGLKFAVKKVTGKPIKAGDLYDIVKKPKENADKSKKDLQEAIMAKIKEQNRPS